MKTKQVAMPIPSSLIVLALAALLFFASLSTAYAQDTSAEASASVDTTVQVDTPYPRWGEPARPRPLQILHDKRLELQNQAKDAIQNLKQEGVDIRATLKVDLKNATSGAERRKATQHMQDRQGALREQTAEIRGNMKERLQILMRTHIGSVLARFTAAIRHLENLATRIESRIEKLNERGIDTTSVEASLAAAIGLTAEAKLDIETLETLIQSVTDTSDPTSVRQELRAAMQEATTSVKAAHQALLKTARELSALVRISTESEVEARVDSE